MKVKQSIINYLTIQLKQDPHGFYPKGYEVAKQLQVSDATITNYYQQVINNLQDAAYLEAVQKEIPHFDILWENFVDSKIKNDLSRRQQQILTLQFEEKNGVIRERSPKEMAEIISTDVLHFDEVFVIAQQKKIEKLLYLKEKYNLSPSYKKVRSVKVTETERKYLMAQLRQDPHGFYPKGYEVAKQLQVSDATITNYYQQVTNNLQDATYLEAVQKEIPHFDVLWENFVDSKIKNDLSRRQQQILTLQFEEKNGVIRERTPKEMAEIISTDVLHFDEVFVIAQQKKIEKLLLKHKNLKEKYNLSPSYKKVRSVKVTETERKYLISQLRQDPHGFYPSVKSIAKQLQVSSMMIHNYYRQITNKLQNSAYLEKVQQEIPYFDLLWEDFVDSKTEKDLSKRQQQILALQFEKKEDGSIYRRTPKEIARMISTDILSFDEVFVTEQQKKINLLFHNYKDLKEKYNALTRRRRPYSIKLTENEKKYLAVQLKQDQHGFYPKQKEVVQKLQTSCAVVNQYYNTVTNKLQHDAYLEAVQKEIPHFDLLWDDFVDSKTEKDLSKRQQQILKEQFEIKEDGSIHRRTPKEIAAVISNDILSFDEVFVEAQQRKIERLFYNYKELKEKYKVEPAYPRKVQLTEEDILLLKEKYRFDPVTKRYFSSQEQAKKLGAPVKNLVIQDALLLEKLGQPTVKENRNQEKTLIFSELESSIFHDFVALCSDNEKQALALRLGYFDGLIHETEEVAKLCHLSLEDVSHLTRNCLQTGKETLEGLIQKGHQKKKS